MLNLSFLTLILSLFLSISSSTSEKYTYSSNSTIEVKGTSSLHDWTMKIEKTSGQVTLEFGEDGQLTLEGLKICAKAEDFKSGHKGMDRNAYKALKTDKYPSIVFEMTKLNNVRLSADGKEYKVSCMGKLTLAGTTKTISLLATIKKSNENTLLFSGSKELKMTDFGIEPPTALLGTVKTGNDITILYKGTFNK